MPNNKLFISSHAPYWHNGSSVAAKGYDIILAALPAVVFGLFQYGIPALAVVTLSISSAVGWEYLMNRLMKRPISIGDLNAATIGLLLAMLLPASVPWWLVVVGTFVAVVVGKQIFGGIGCNPLNPALVAVAILMLSWKGLLDFNEALVDFDLSMHMIYPLGAAKLLGLSSLNEFTATGLLLGQQPGGIGAVFGLGLIIGGVYLILRGHVRWEIPVSFLASVFLCALLFNFAGPDKYAGPFFHLLTGYTLIGAFFLAPEDSSSPVNFWPMLIYGAGAGLLTVLIRNLGTFFDGVAFAILLMNIANPLLDKIRPKALGKETQNA